MSIDMPLVLEVTEEFEYVNRGLQRASDWLRYTVHPGRYPITYHTVRGDRVPGVTLAETRAYAREHDADWWRPDHAVARMDATLTESYYESQLLHLVSGHQERRDESGTVAWRPYTYELMLGMTVYGGKAVVVRAEPGEVPAA